MARARHIPHIRHDVRRRPTNADRRRQARLTPACLAYREMRQAGASDQEAHEAAVAAAQEVLSSPSWKEASYP
jgi:hypothetical protein